MNHSLNLTHDGTLIVRVPKGYKVEKVKVETFEGEVYTEPDGCKDCKYELTEEWEEPCRRCCNSYKNMWRAKNDH